MTGRAFRHDIPVCFDQVDFAGAMRPMNAADEILGRGRRLAGDDAVALIDGQRTCTYRQLESLVNRYGHAMLEHGVRVENRVLFLLDDGPDLVAAYLAAMRIGAVAVAVSLRSTTADLEHFIRESRARMLFIENDLLARFADCEDRLEDKPALVVHNPSDAALTSMEDFVSGRPESLRSAEMNGDDMALWVYSSGTTGRPKAVVHLHHDVLDASRHLVENLGVKPRDRLFCTSKLFFAYALGNSLLGGLCAGATLVLNRGWPDADRIADVVRRQQPDYFFTVPTFYRNLLESGKAEQSAFRELRGCVSAGEALPDCLFHAWRETTGRTIHEGLGTSETLFLFIASHPAACRPGRIGRAHPWVDTRLFDEEGRAIEDADTPGCLWIRTGSVADRYWNRQQLSRETFVGDWYATGDMLSVDEEGWWRYHGRHDSMIKISGQWVSPLEIEERACCAAEVLEAGAVAGTAADGLACTTLFVVPARPPDNEAVFQETLREHLRSGLAGFKCPRQIRLVRELPRTATGKIQRHILREWLTSPHTK